MKFRTKTWKTFLIGLLISQTAFGLDAKYLPKGDAAPFEGYLLSVPKAKEVRVRLLENDNLKLINDSLKTSLSLQKDINALTEDKVKILSTQNDKLSKSLMDERSVSNWERIFWFSLGVVATGVAVWGLRRVSQ